jgi:hypothetical protein
MLIFHAFRGVFPFLVLQEKRFYTHKAPQRPCCSFLVCLYICLVYTLAVHMFSVCTRQMYSQNVWVLHCHGRSVNLLVARFKFAQNCKFAQPPTHVFPNHMVVTVYDLQSTRRSTLKCGPTPGLNFDAIYYGLQARARILKCVCCPI